MIKSVTTVYKLQYFDFERMIFNIIDALNDENATGFTKDLCTDISLFLSTILMDKNFLIPKFCGGQLDMDITTLWKTLTEVCNGAKQAG